MHAQHLQCPPCIPEPTWIQRGEVRQNKHEHQLHRCRAVCLFVPEVPPQHGALMRDWVSQAHHGVGRIKTSQDCVG